MKKLFFSLAFMLFGAFTFANNSTEKINSEGFFGCWETADMLVRISEAYAECNGHSLTYEQAHDVWVAAYETCIS